VAFPNNYSRVWVRGKLIDLAKSARGSASEGVSGPIQFIPTPSALIDSGTRQYIAPTGFTVQPSATDGGFAIQLPATNDPDINPQGWNYKVVLPWGEVFYMVVPYNTANLNSPGDPLHGSPVIEITSVTPDPDANPGTLQVITGADGRSITGASINGSNHLILTLSDSSTLDAGTIVAGIDAEGARDAVGTALVGGTGTTVTVNDGADTITIATSAILPTLVDAKGDLLAGTADNTVARLAVGSNGQVLTADSTQTAGVRWGTPAATSYVYDTPSAHSLIEWNYDPLQTTQSASAAATLTSGTVHLAKLVAQTGGTITTISVNVITAGASLTSGQCFAGIYNSSGTRLAVTADQSAVWNTADIYQMSLTSSTAITAGQTYYVALLAVGTTPPKFAQGPSSAKAANVGLTGASLRFATNGTSQTSLPSTRTMSSNTATSAVTFWCALS
jgi:hypothetical protein